MTARRISLFIITCLLVAVASSSCRKKSSTFVISLGDPIRTIDPIGSPSVDAASERVRTLIFNSLVKKNEKFDYVGELAENIQRSDDGLTYAFTLRDGVKFHDGRPLTSADAKYTLDLVFSSTIAKSATFFEGSGDKKRISTAGGISPRWSRDGKELFYVSPDSGSIMAVAVSLSPTFTAAIPVRLFDLQSANTARRPREVGYDVSPDGRSFLLSTPPEQSLPGGIAVVLNWQRELAAAR